tara:strand:- start:496 stop:648 length:153 start_codon:yes stop_codon:yes gene_type:complete
LKFLENKVETTYLYEPWSIFILQSPVGELLTIIIYNVETKETEPLDFKHA